MTKRVRLIAIVAAVVVLLGAGAYVGVRMLSDGINSAIPQDDLFGTPTPDGSSPGATPSPTPPPGADIKGPLDILLVGVDTRAHVKNWTPRADTIMIMHVDASLTKAYLTSLPRDLVVNIPAFAPARFGGARTKINAAMAYGSRVPGTRTPNAAQGFQLLARTVSNYTGIKEFDAGALLTFNGLKHVVDAIGGIDMYIDQRVVSIHMRPDGKHRAPCGSCEHGYSGPRMVYNVGKRHLNGWQALDLSRQRYISGADYARTRHQRQIIKAIVAKAFSADVLTNPAALNKVFNGLNKDRLIVDTRGHTPLELAYALRNLNTSSITLVGLPGSSAYSGGSYIGENLTGIRSSYFAALRKDTLDAFLKANPRLINSDPR